MRQGYIDHKKKIVFFWSQKSACTTLFTMLTREYGENNKFYHSNSSPWQTCLEAIDTKGYKSFALVRNPASRIVSSYVNKFVEYSGKRLKTRDQLELFSKNFLQAHDAREGRTPDQIDEKIDISFEGFLKTVHYLHVSRARDKDFFVNGHWDTQTPKAMRNYSYDFVAKIEDSPEALQEYCALSGLTFSAERRNSSNYAEMSKAYLGKIPAYKFGKRDINTKSFLKPASKQLINKLFAVDFQTFGYPLEG